MPRATRLIAPLVAFLTVTVLGTATAPPASAAAVTAGTEVEITRLVNDLRAQHGLSRLRIDVRLVADARRWSGHMAATGTLAHDPGASQQMPPGTVLWAENVAWTGATTDIAARLHAMFANSPGHRRNLLDGRLTDLGVGVATSGGRTYVTQRFTAGAPARVAAAVEPTARLAEQHFGGGKAAHAVIARDDVYADALASGPLAGRTGPIVLTPPGPALHPVVRQALDRVLPRGGTVWLVGGTAAVSAGVEAEVAAAGWNVERVAGSNRFATAAHVAKAVAARDGRPGEVVIATGGGWADAAAGGAYGARTGTPVLLALKDSVPSETADALGALRPRRVAALGGTAVLSDRTLARLGASRVSGPTRQDTAAFIARDLWGHTSNGPARWLAVPGFGGDAWTWALGAAPVAARQGAPVLLVGPELTPPLKSYLSNLGGSATLLTHGPVPADSAAQLRSLID